MPKIDTKRKTFTELIQEMDEMLSVSVTQDDAKKIIDTFAQKLKENAEAYSQKLNENKVEMADGVQSVRDELAQLQTSLQETINSVDQKSGTTLAEAIQQIRNEIKVVQDAIPPETDLSEVFAAQDELREKLTRTEENILSENLRNALELLEEDERLDIGSIRGAETIWEQLDTIFEDLKTIPRVAGVRFLKYMADVNAEDIEDGETLVYEAATGTFKPGSGSGGYTNLTQFVDQTAHRVFYSNADGDVTELALGADGTFLKSNGATSAPSFATPAGGGDVVGPASATDDNIAVYDGVTGKIIKDGGATVAGVRDRSTHTGTQAASTISDFQTTVSANTDVTANTAKVTNATHTGDVTGATALTIANNAVTNAKAADMATSTIKGRVTAATGDPEDLTATQVRTLLNVADGATANSADATLLARANHTGTQAISTVTGLQTALDTKPTISSGAGAPATTPSKVGDIYIDTTNDTYYVAVGTASSADWEANGSAAGDVVGPASATDNTLARFDGTTGKVIQDSLVSISDFGSFILGNVQEYKISRPDNTIMFLATDVGFLTSTTSSAVNYIEIRNANTGGSLTISALGTDTNIPIDILPKGTGEAQVNGQKIIDESDTDYVKLAAVTGAVVGTTDTQTITNKRVNPRTSSTASTATLTPSLATANVFYVTAQAAALTIAAPTGTPVIGETISINIKDNATARGLTFNAAFKFLGTAAPTTTTISKWLTVTAQYAGGGEWLTTYAEEV